MRALIVDDSPTTRSFLRGLLGELGFSTVEAEDGEQGLACVAQDPDLKLVLIDWNMPVMDGLGLLRSIREHPHLKGLAVVMVTTEASLDRVREAMDAGADEYIMKPFTREVLEEKLRLIGLEAG